MRDVKNGLGFCALVAVYADGADSVGIETKRFDGAAAAAGGSRRFQALKH